MNVAFSCVDGVERLTDYFEQVLPAAQRAAVDAHMAGCPRCVAFVRSYRETPRILRAATVAVLPPEIQASLGRFLADRRR